LTGANIVTIRGVSGTAEYWQFLHGFVCGFEDECWHVAAGSFAMLPGHEKRSYP
jgi:hypothetical protein